MLLHVHVQCYSRWNGRSPSSLSNLLQELLSEYRSHHRALACQYQRLNFEMQTLLDSGQFQDIDVHCTRRTDSVGRVYNTCMREREREQRCITGNMGVFHGERKARQIFVVAPLINYCV